MSILRLDLKELKEWSDKIEKNLNLINDFFNNRVLFNNFSDYLKIISVSNSGTEAEIIEKTIEDDFRFWVSPEIEKIRVWLKCGIEKTGTGDIALRRIKVNFYYPAGESWKKIENKYKDLKDSNSILVVDLKISVPKEMRGKICRIEIVMSSKIPVSGEANYIFRGLLIRAGEKD